MDVYKFLEFMLQAANVGDSAAFFARVPQRRNSAPDVVQLTGDHRYTNPLERERLAGAPLSRISPLRFLHSTCCLLVRSIRALQQGLFPNSLDSTLSEKTKELGRARGNYIP